MPNIIEITDFSAPELDVYARLTQAQLRNRLEPEKGVFMLLCGNSRKWSGPTACPRRGCFPAGPG